MKVSNNKNCVLKVTNAYDEYINADGVGSFNLSDAPRYTYSEAIEAKNKLDKKEIEVIAVYDAPTELKAIFFGGRYNRKVVSVVDLYAEATGLTDDLTEVRENGGLCHRKELDNQPIIKGYIGPMWDGGRLRYETQEVYDMLSR
jgi:hypothetical protein